MTAASPSGPSPAADATVPSAFGSRCRDALAAESRPCLGALPSNGLWLVGGTQNPLRFEPLPDIASRSART